MSEAAVCRSVDTPNDSGKALGRSLASRCAIALIKGYQRFVSPAFPRVCRFHPTCSSYAREAIVRYGFLRGSGMAIVRLSKCHPFHKGGFDPVK